MATQAKVPPYVECLALLGILTPNMNQDEISWFVFNMTGMWPIPDGPEDFNERELAGLKALSRAERLAIRDKLLGVTEFAPVTPQAIESLDDDETL